MPQTRIHKEDVATEIRIGTSGYHYAHWRGPFYPEKFPASKMLDFYVQRFDTVELNSTFYRLPPQNAVRSWRNETPPEFLFAAKGSRFLTHMKKLRDATDGLHRFFEHIGELEEKLGPIVFQLPPFWNLHLERLQGFLSALPQGRRYAFEFRNPSWHCEEVYNVLTAHNAAFCPFDLAGYQSPILLTADFAYIRLHGPGPGPYQGLYDDSALENWAARIRAWKRRLRAVYLYFDNDMSGFAPQNAAELRSKLRLA